MIAARLAFVLALLPLVSAADEGEIVLPHLSVALPAGPVERAEADHCDGGLGPCKSTWLSVEGAGGIHWRVALLQPRRPVDAKRLRGYLAAWRRNHGCVATPIKRFPPSLRSGRAPPQLTFEGVCEGGDRYRMRFLVVGEVAYELHVDAPLGVAGDAALDAAFRELLQAVRLVTGGRSGTGDRRCGRRCDR